ncbi:MAG: hypothetical protein OEV92_06640 [Nitrospinota bacterium]|nr:hypothetical protein [Nitrospinota bacterium]
MAAALAAACSSGSGGSGSGVNNAGAVTEGVYDFKLDIANVTCSDGSQGRQGFDFTAEISRNGEFLEIKNVGKTIGRGNAGAGGKFRLSGNFQDQGYNIAAVLEGQAGLSSLSGIAKSAFDTPEGLVCHQASTFTANLRKGGA